jgi:hypothetical protein
MEVTTIKPTVVQSNFTAPKRNDVAKEVQTQQAVNASIDPIVVDQQVTDLSQPEKQRLDTVVKGAQSFQKTLGPSGTTFTIFKDASGQFITRFTNRTTGAVTYVPEPNLLNLAETSSTAMVEVQA